MSATAPVTPPTEPTPITSISITNTRAIAEALIPVPEGGGLVILEGQNGTGKSTALECVRAVLGGEHDLNVKRGTANGAVKAGGVTITLGKQTRKRGTAQVQSIEGRFSIDELIDPMVKDPAAADSRRIKALLRITGATIGRDEWAKAVGGDAATQATEDPVESAAKIAKFLQAQAREAEEAAIKERSAADALEASIPAATSNMTEAEAVKALESAIKAEQAVKTRRETAIEQAAQLEKDQKALYAAIAATGGQLSVEQRKADLLASQVKVSEAESLVRHLTEQLTKANQALNTARTEVNHRTQMLASAEQQQKQIEAMTKAAKRTPPACPADDELAAASNGVLSAREQLRLASLAKSAAENRQKVADLRKKADDSTTRAVSLRKLADAPDAVLTEAVAKLGCPISVSSGRLRAKNRQGDVVNFSELSPGERTRLAVDVAADAVGEDGWIVLDQSRFEGLDPQNVNDLIEHTCRRRVVLFTARAADRSQVTPIVFTTATNAIDPNAPSEFSAVDSEKLAGMVSAVDFTF